MLSNGLEGMKDGVMSFQGLDDAQSYGWVMRLVCGLADLVRSYSSPAADRWVTLEKLLSVSEAQFLIYKWVSEAQSVTGAGLPWDSPRVSTSRHGPWHTSGGASMFAPSLPPSVSGLGGLSGWGGHGKAFPAKGTAWEPRARQDDTGNSTWCSRRVGMRGRSCRPGLGEQWSPGCHHPEGGVRVLGAPAGRGGFLGTLLWHPASAWRQNAAARSPGTPSARQGQESQTN